MIPSWAGARAPSARPSQTARDDLIVHTTGEMTNPLPLEDCLLGSLRHAGVARLAVVGQRRPLCALVLERSAFAPRKTQSACPRQKSAPVAITCSQPRLGSDWFC